MAGEQRFLVIEPPGRGGEDDGVAHGNIFLPVTDIYPEGRFPAGIEMGAGGADHAGDITLGAQDEYRDAGQVVQVKPAQPVEPDEFVDFKHGQAELVRMGYQRQRALALAPFLPGDEITYLIDVNLINVFLQQLLEPVGHPAFISGRARDLHQFID